MTNDERMDFLIGQIAVLKAFCIATVIAHPRPDEILKHFNRASEITTAKTLSTVASDSMLQGIESMTNDLLHVIKGESKRKDQTRFNQP